jgi:hypothetical protein
MPAGRSIALPDSGCPLRGRDPARRSAALSPDEPDCEPDPEVTRDEEPEEEDPELPLDPLRGAADPDLPLDDEEGVREPAGVCTRGGSDSRDDDGALETVDPPEEPPEEPDEPDPELVGRGIAWAYVRAGTASAIASATTTSERGFLSMTMHSFNGS